MNKRTPKDEQDYTESLRREEPIKTEVIIELRDQNRILWKNQERLMTELIAAQAALQIYRQQVLDDTTKRITQLDNGHCFPGCPKHEWDTKDGWHRKP